MAHRIDKLVAELKNAETILARQQKIIESLHSENDLLSSTILTKEMGKISEERRQFRQEVRESKDAERRSSIELQNYKAEFDSKYDELDERLQDVKTKQEELDNYIASTAADMIIDEKRHLEEQYSSKVKSLKTRFVEQVERLNKSIITRNRIIYFIAVYAVIVTVILIIWR